MRHKLAAIACGAVLIGWCISVPPAWADASNQKINFTVKKGPVEVPGSVLVPGSYSMEFSDENHGLVLITTADGKRPVGFFEVIPELRDRRSSHVKLQISNPVMGEAPRLDGFFYPNAKTGYEFLYPSTHGM